MQRLPPHPTLSPAKLLRGRGLVPAVHVNNAREPRARSSFFWNGDVAKCVAHAALAAVCAFAAASAVAAVGPNIQAVQPDQVDNYWVRTKTSLTVDVPNSGVNLSKPTCSAVTYMIGSDGVTRDIVVRRTVPAGDLESVAASAVKDFHYVPGADNAAREPVFTYIIIPFNLPSDPVARKRITNACVLKDFPRGYR